MRKRRERVILRIASELGMTAEQFAEQNKVKTFHLEKFLKEYRRTKMGSHTWKTSQHGDAKEQE
ncbi:Uncharacterised protein [Escherichia coli]|uniref:hypothetical protein n=1 Tax=Escherichia coli TaxID=562 RepID=UPI000EF2C076|nr:hypothetical protein [Escherichia coli]AYL86465.1 hypothetical protein AOY71_11155 [Escherichia coli]EFN8468152.1 hypothetical protein [Escherichia coli]EJN3552870.1 hypothetical protein [Escherichia coli]EJN3609806.1 hypothetical protein [Escherichia coli]EJN3614613.1 hypothetical protein [Escherichia coli]